MKTILVLFSISRTKYKCGFQDLKASVSERNENMFFLFYYLSAKSFNKAQKFNTCKMIYDRNVLNLQYWHMHIISRGFHKPQYRRFNKQMLPINHTKHSSFYKSFAFLQDVFNYFKEQNILSSTIGGKHRNKPMNMTFQVSNITRKTKVFQD